MAKRAIWGTVLIISILAIVLFNIFKTDRILELNYAAPVKGEIVDRVFANGKFEAVNLYPQYSAENVLVKEVLVKVGDSVSAGQPLLKFNLEEQEKQLKQEENNLQVMQQERANLRQQFVDKMKSKRIQEGIISPFDDEKPDTSSVDARINNQELLIESLRKKATSDSMNATKDGVITELHADAGQLLPQGTKAIVITDTKKLQVRVGVNELDASKVHPGMSAEISGDAFQGIYPGEIRTVAPIAAPSSSAGKDAIVEVLIGMVSSPSGQEGSELKPGYNASVEIKLPGQPRLLLPLTAIKHEGDHAFVYKTDNGKVVKAGVKVGKEDQDHVEILEGVKESDSIVSTIPKELHEGSKVKQP